MPPATAAPSPSTPRGAPDPRPVQPPAWAEAPRPEPEVGSHPSRHTLGPIQMLLHVPPCHPVSVFPPLFTLYFPHKTSDAICLPKRFRHLIPRLTCHSSPSHVPSNSGWIQALSYLCAMFPERLLCPVFQLLTVQTALPHLLSLVAAYYPPTMWSTASSQTLPQDSPESH